MAFLQKNKVNQINLYISPSVFKYLPCVYMNGKNKKEKLYHSIDYSKYPRSIISLIISILKKINTCFSSILSISN